MEYRQYKALHGVYRTGKLNIRLCYICGYVVFFPLQFLSHLARRFSSKSRLRAAFSDGLVCGIAFDTDIDCPYYQDTQNTFYRKPSIPSYDIDNAHCHGDRRLDTVFAVRGKVGYGSVACYLLGMDCPVPIVLCRSYALCEDMVLQSFWR